MALEAIMLSEDKIQSFATSLVNTKKNIKFCSSCFYLSWDDKCHICLDDTRKQDTICVVSEPKDVLSIEQSKTYRGLFHVLGGVISPLDGMYPELLRFKELKDRVPMALLILFWPKPNSWGDTTSLYIQTCLKEHQLIFINWPKVPIGSGWRR